LYFLLIDQISIISDNQELQEHRDLSDIEYDSFLGAKNELTNVYRDEVIYWQ
jgi:hypothetical protein